MSIQTFISILFYLLIATVTIAMAYQVKNGYEIYGITAYDETGNRSRISLLNRIWLTGIFAILFLCAAFRFGIGNDYVQYTQTAHEAYVGGYVVTEIGFNWLVKLLYTLCGWECYELVFAVFSLITIVIFIKAMYDQSVNFSFSFFLFMTFGLYFQTYNTMRYYLALAITLYSMRYVLNKDIIRFVFWIVIAALFHKSVLVVIPVYLIASYAWKKWQIAVGLIGSGLCYVGKDLVLKLALKLYPSYENTIYLENSDVSLVSILKGLAILGLYLWLRYRYKANSRELRFYAQLNLLSVVVCLFFSFLPVITRIAYYFSVSQILMLPKMIAEIPEEDIKKKVTYVVIIASVIYFFAFLLTANQPGVGLLPYRSWLFETQRYIYK